MAFHFNINPIAPMPEAAKVLIGPAEIALTLTPLGPKSDAR